MANEAVDALAAFLHSDGAVDPWLADQLLLPLAMADGPSVLRTSEVTLHQMSDPSEIDAGAQDGPVLRIECYAGHRADAEPLRLHIGRREIAVTEIVDRWLDPRHRYFKLRGDDGGIYLLRHDTMADSWEMTLYDSGRLEDTRLSST